MDTPIVRWGILGAADIARKNWKAIWNSGNGRLLAVASRDVDRGGRFVAECQSQAQFDPAPRVLGSYEELIAAPEIDAVYIPLPTRVRKEWVMRAAEAGKHVICEKPCAVSVADLEDMTEACQRNCVQFSDGVMFMHSQRMKRVQEVLGDPHTIGAVRRITSAFAFGQPDSFFASNIRVRSELEPDGCLGDLGWYCIRFALWAMEWKLPRTVTGRILSERKHPESEFPVPTEFSGELIFEDGISSGFYCSFLTGIEQCAVISGTRGHLRIADFVLPFAGAEVAFETSTPTFEAQGCDFKMRPELRRWSIREHSDGHPNAQETKLFRQFGEQVLSGILNPDWPEQALKTQRVMEACRQSSKASSASVAVS